MPSNAIKLRHWRETKEQKRDVWRNPSSFFCVKQDFWAWQKKRGDFRRYKEWSNYAIL